ncbi:MAG: TIGR02996 domain-containing protein, partial [Gemmataceae bacterium]
EKGMDRPRSFLEKCLPDEDERSFMRAIHEKPDDPAARLIYADWLEERGDPRAEFLRVQQALKSRQSDQELLSRLEVLRSTLLPEWLSMIGDTLARFAPLQEEVYRSDRDRGWEPFLKVTSNLGLLDVHYHGDLQNGWGVERVLDFLKSREVAPVLHSLLLDGHEDRSRSNGTLDIDLDCWLAKDLEFPNLESLATEQGSGVIIGFYEEEGRIARLLQRCPALRRLTIPSAPNADFFKLGDHPLEHLNVAAGYDCQNFMVNLAQASCFPNLKQLAFTDYIEDYMDDFAQRCTPFDHYREFFQSPIQERLDTITLREVMLSRQQVDALLSIRSSGVSITRHAQTP